MSYLSIANKYMSKYLNIYELENYNEEDIRNLIIDEFKDFLTENKYNNLDIYKFKELYISNEFKKKLFNNPKYHLYILNKKISNISNKINMILFVISVLIVKQYFNYF